jgi:hypothetical protein
MKGNKLWKIAINTETYIINNAVPPVKEFKTDINKLAASTDTRFL